MKRHQHIYILLLLILGGCGTPESQRAPSSSGSNDSSSNERPPRSTPTATPRPTATPTPGPTTTPTPTPGSGRQVAVASTAQLTSAVSSAQPGDVITIAPGTYSMSSKISVTRSGTSAARITVRASNLGDVVLRTTNPEPFFVNASYWTFENLTMEGVCGNHSDCEHAFHIVGLASNTILRNNILRDYNAQIKGNGNNGTVFPNDVLVENNVFYDRTGRSTSNPVTKIDIVGGRRWIVRGNTIGDYYKNGGDGVSYGAFLKGNSRDGIFENNVVACSKNHTGGIRIGLSFGGGGSSPDSVCEGGSCAIEHTNGLMRNNVIMNCSDVGIYINEGSNSQIYNNTLYQTGGIDIRFAVSTAFIRANIVSGAIRNRDGGSSTASANLTGVTGTLFNSYFMNPISADFSLKDGTAYVNKAPLLPSVVTDFCGHARTSTPDLGAVEFATGSGCANTVRTKYNRF